MEKRVKDRKLFFFGSVNRIYGETAKSSFFAKTYKEVRNTLSSKQRTRRKKKLKKSNKNESQKAVHSE